MSPGGGADRLRRGTASQPVGSLDQLGSGSPEQALNGLDVRNIHGSAVDQAITTPVVDHLTRNDPDERLGLADGDLDMHRTVRSHWSPWVHIGLEQPELTSASPDAPGARRPCWLA